VPPRCFEGIANNAILIAHGVTEVDQLADDDLQIGVLLALLQDDAKNQSSYLTWGEGRQQSEVRARCGAISWSRKNAPINCPAPGTSSPDGPMYLPSYRSGTEKVAELRRTYSPGKVLPAIYGCNGLVDIQTIDQMLKARSHLAISHKLDHAPSM